MYAGYGSAAATVLAGLTGRLAIEFVIDGDSNESGAYNGTLSLVARNASLIPYQICNGQGGLWQGGWLRAGQSSASSVWTTQSPTYQRPINGGAMLSDANAIAGLTGTTGAAETGGIRGLYNSLPPAWVNNAYSMPWVLPARTGAGQYGFVMQLQSTGECVDPVLGMTVGPGAIWWPVDETSTYLDVECLCCNGTGFVDEIVIDNTPTDLLYTVSTIPASTSQQLISGTGSTALALTSNPLMSDDSLDGRPTLKRTRIGPLTWKTSGSTKKSIHCNITGNGGKAIITRARFVRPGKKGLSFSAYSAKGGQTLAAVLSDNPSCGAVYSGTAAFDTAVTQVLWIQLGVNDSYNDNATPDTFLSRALAYVAQRRADFGNPQMAVVLSMVSYRDNNLGSKSAQDANFDQYPGVIDQAVRAGQFGNAMVLNTRLWMDAIGANRANENIFSLLIGSAVTNMGATRDQLAQWNLGTVYSTATSNLLGCAQISVPMVLRANHTAAANNSPAYGGNGPTNWYPMRPTLSINAGTPDTPHFSGHGMQALRRAETQLLIQAAYALSSSGNVGSRSRVLARP